MRRLTSLLLAGTLALTACAGEDDAATSSTAAPATTRRAAAATTAPTTTSSTTSTTTPSTTSTTTTTTTAATVAATATTAVPLPTPIAPPPEDGTTEETFEVATLEIPALGLRTPVWEGIRLSTLDRGPGHWPGTAMPGQPGNVVVSAHRTTHGAEFRRLDDLELGDEVIMSTLAGRFVYHVRRVEVVEPDALWIVDQTPAHTATLFACHPPGSVRQRIVAHLELAP